MDMYTVLSHAETVSLISCIVEILDRQDAVVVTEGLGWLKQTLGAKQIVLYRVIFENRHPVLDQLFNYSVKMSWLERYKQEEYADIDPILERAGVESFFDWEIRAGNGTNKRETRFLQEAVANDLSNGITASIPVHDDIRDIRTVCLLTKVDPCQREKAKAIIQALLPALSIALGWDVLPGMVGDSQLTTKLTQREKQVLEWVSLGKGVWEISQILKISESTVKFHLNNTYRKLNVTSRPYAIAKAIRLGLL